VDQELAEGEAGKYGKFRRPLMFSARGRLFLIPNFIERTAIAVLFCLSLVTHVFGHYNSAVFILVKP